MLTDNMADSTNFEFYAVLAGLVLNFLISVYQSKILRALNKSKKAKSKIPKNQSLSLAKNSKVLNHKNPIAKNDASEFQKIKTSEVTLPVIKATVLNYSAGELGESFSEPTRLYYSPESLRDKEFLDSIIRSPWNTQTHELNTGEYNLKVDGWANESWFDEKDKTAYAKGFLIGENNIDYAKDNQNKPGFGTSAFISFLKIDREKGITPEGLEYDAIARKCICNHVAILPNIRDEKNVIVSINAKNAIVETPKKLIGVKNMEQSEFNSMMENYEKEKNSRNELKEQIKNEIMEEMKQAKNEEDKKEPEKKEEPKAGNEDKPEPEKKKEPKAGNEDKPEPEKKEPETAENALPSEKLVGVFSDHYGIRFKKTPTVKELAEIAEIPFTTFAQTLNALRKKSEEIVGSVTNSTTSTTNEKPLSIEETLRSI